MIRVFFRLGRSATERPSLFLATRRLLQDQDDGRQQIAWFGHVCQAFPLFNPLEPFNLAIPRYN